MQGSFHCVADLAAKPQDLADEMSRGINHKYPIIPESHTSKKKDRCPAASVLRLLEIQIQYHCQYNKCNSKNSCELYKFSFH